MKERETDKTNALYPVLCCILVLVFRFSLLLRVRALQLAVMLFPHFSYVR
jgi:hypothetical protein